MQEEEEPSKGEKFFFFLARVLAFVFTFAGWVTVGLAVWSWMMLRTVLSFSFAMVTGLLHGGRDFSGASRSLETVSGLWWKGILQICEMLDPKKRPRIQEIVPFNSRRVVIDGIFTVSLVLILFFGEQVFRVGVLDPVKLYMRRYDSRIPRIAIITNKTTDRVIFEYPVMKHTNVMTIFPKQHVFVRFPETGSVTVGIYENDKTTSWTLSYAASSANNSATENSVAFDIERDSKGQIVFKTSR